MTIQERIERFKHKWEPDVPRKFFEDDLNELLNQVAKEQRELCAERVNKRQVSQVSADGQVLYNYKTTSKEEILNSPSPLETEDT